jgi:hypothetical protein
VDAAQLRSELERLGERSKNGPGDIEVIVYDAQQHHMLPVHDVSLVVENEQGGQVEQLRIGIDLSDGKWELDADETLAMYLLDKAAATMMAERGMDLQGAHQALFDRLEATVDWWKTASILAARREK